MRLRPLAIALALGAAAAEEPDPRLYAPPSADRTPTTYACTVDTLLSGRDCVLEGQAPPSADPRRQAEENGRAAAALGEKACARAARLPADPRPDPQVLAACRREFSRRAAGCAADGSAPLLDAEGRFGAGARACYAAMSAALARVRLMASATGACCRCMVSAGCARSGELCNQGLASGSAGPSRCMEAKCGDDCRAFVPEPAPPPFPPPSAPPPPPGVTGAPGAAGEHQKRL